MLYMHFDLICIQPSLNQPVTLLYWGRKMLSVCRRQYKAFVSVPGCLGIQNQRPHQGESISKLQLLSFRKDFGDDSNAVSTGSVLATQRLKLRKKKVLGRRAGARWQQGHQNCLKNWCDTWSWSHRWRDSSGLIAAPRAPENLFAC